MAEAALIYPHQLFKDHPAIKKGRKLYFYEEPLFFDPKFHKQKLLLHRASMKRFAASHPSHTYLDFNEDLEKQLKKDGIDQLFIVDPVDHRVEKKLKKLSIQIHWLKSPNFLTDPDEYTPFFESQERYHQTDFYIWQRKRLDLLMDGKVPEGGKWTYDTDNRKKLPKSLTPSPPYSFRYEKDLQEAIGYVKEHFSKSPGTLDGFNYPICSEQAEALLDDFFEKRLEFFGPFQDAITNRSETLFHSCISAPLNIGLLSPEKVVKGLLQQKGPLGSIEGFLRQLIGWREFFRAIYDLEGEKLRKQNALNHKNSLSSKWYKGTLGIPPMDDMIHKLEKTAYAHHIERLMIAGNLMLLSEIDPDEVYHWFMEFFIDSYDWVMVPNVYSMSQYADDGLLVTKPYISSSNYIRKMSDYPKGAWCDIWDGLYWSFLIKNQDWLESNPRMTMIYSVLRKMDASTKKRHQKNAEAFKATL